MSLYLWLKNLLESEEGQDLIEYALLVVFIALVVILVLPNVGNQVANVFNNIVTQLTSGT